MLRPLTGIVSAKLTAHLNDIWEIDFEIDSVLDGKANPIYGKLHQYMEIKVDTLGWFRIDETPTEYYSDGRQYKTFTAVGYESSLQDLDLNLFSINCATPESIEMYEENVNELGIPKHNIQLYIPNASEDATSDKYWKLGLLNILEHEYDELKPIFEDPTKTAEMTINLAGGEIAHYYSLTHIVAWGIKPEANTVSVSLQVAGFEDQMDNLESQMTETKQQVAQLDSKVTEMESNTASLSNKVTEVTESAEALNTPVMAAAFSVARIQAQTFSDIQALSVQDIYEDWEPDQDYVVNQKVNYVVNDEKILYKVLQAHRSQADWTPDAAPSLFAKVLIPDPSVIPEWEQPDSTNPYSAGDKVTHNGKTWESLVDNNVWEPGAVGTESLWKEVTEETGE